MRRWTTIKEKGKWEKVCTRPCCTKHVKDSSRESSVVAGGHEQAHPHDLQDDELAGL